MVIGSLFCVVVISIDARKGINLPWLNSTALYLIILLMILNAFKLPGFTLHNSVRY
jgi:hypothetical protein